jgi:hypothetical protein
MSSKKGIVLVGLLILLYSTFVYAGSYPAPLFPKITYENLMKIEEGESQGIWNNAGMSDLPCILKKIEPNYEDWGIIFRYGEEVNVTLLEDIPEDAGELSLPNGEKRTYRIQYGGCYIKQVTIYNPIEEGNETIADLIVDESTNINQDEIERVFPPRPNLECNCSNNEKNQINKIDSGENFEVKETNNLIYLYDKEPKENEKSILQIIFELLRRIYGFSWA